MNDTEPAKGKRIDKVARHPATGQPVVIGDFTVDELANDGMDAAINAGCKAIQDKMGITAGDVAGQFWTGGPEDHVKDLFAAYVRAELVNMPAEKPA